MGGRGDKDRKSSQILFILFQEEICEFEMGVGDKPDYNNI